MKRLALAICLVALSCQSAYSLNIDFDGVITKAPVFDENPDILDEVGLTLGNTFHLQLNLSGFYTDSWGASIDSINFDFNFNGGFTLTSTSSNTCTFGWVEDNSLWFITTEAFLTSPDNRIGIDNAICRVVAENEIDDFLSAETIDYGSFFLEINIYNNITSDDFTEMHLSAVNTSPVPEPSTIILLAIGSVVFVAKRKFLKN